jgi:ubiquinone/menaquinone biosynthesis C-methylase UbiE
LNSTARVNGIDLSKKMLEILRSKNKDKKGTLNLIVGSYFEVELAPEVFDVAISVQSMHRTEVIALQEDFPHFSG